MLHFSTLLEECTKNNILMWSNLSKFLSLGPSARFHFDDWALFSSYAWFFWATSAQRRFWSKFNSFGKVFSAICSVPKISEKNCLGWAKESLATSLLLIRRFSRTFFFISSTSSSIIKMLGRFSSSSILRCFYYS